MMPIFEQKRGKGLGHSIKTFGIRFIEICKEAKSKNKRKTFAFILYNFEDTNIKKILKNDGVFTRLDRLTGTSLDVFYFNSNDDYSIQKFNEIILKSFDFNEGIEIPCVIFFDVFDVEVENIKIVEIEQDNILLGFNEIADILQKQIDAENSFYNDISIQKKGIKFFHSVGEKVGIGLLVNEIKNLF